MKFEREAINARFKTFLQFLTFKTQLPLRIFLTMSETINWLHLTDIHFGLDDHSWLWPKIKHELFRDIKSLGEKVGGWDLVFFTGDFTQHAQKKEYENLNVDLEALWNIFQNIGKIPLLCAVPGNHDLVRPDKGDAVVKALTQLWWSDTDLRRRFWQDPDSEYRIAIKKYFSNYTEWISKLSIPKIEMNNGILPGDFSGTFSKGKIKLGIIGLNSSFLQIVDGDFINKLDMHVAQLNYVCGGDPYSWIKQRTASVLLTHQPPSYLEKERLDEFRQEIYPPGRFLTQFSGHQHEPEALEIIEAGASPRRLRQAPSFFGLENWGSDKPIRRIHGYTAGQYIFEESEVLEKLWPRHSIKGRHGGLNICPDHTYKLQDGDYVFTHFDLDIDGRDNEDSNNKENSTSVANISPAADVMTINDLHLLDGLPDEKTAKERLAHCPRLSLDLYGQQHRNIRLQEQAEVENELRKSRCVWVAANWGTGAEEFLASSIERFHSNDFLPDVFHLRCDDAFDIDRLEAMFPQQFGMALQAFCTLITKLKCSFLVFDDIQPEICEGEPAERLTKMANAIIDYCPDLCLVFVSRIRPELKQFPIVELRPLEIPDVGTYLKHHPEATSDLQTPEVIEKLYEHSDGLPMHLDRIIRALKVSSLASVLDTNMEGKTGTVRISEQTPKALIHAVSDIANSNDNSSKRSFRLLKVLSVLQYGETLETLRHFLPTEPFFEENALQLMKLTLLDVIPLQQTAPNVVIGQPRSNGQSAPKILKVPRQVRDYIQTILSENERGEIVFAGLDKFFGRKWRDGKIRLRSIPLEYRDYLSSGAGNEFALLYHLISQAINNNDDFMVKCGTLLGIAYAEHLNTADRYRDLATVTGPLLKIIDCAEFPNEYSKLAALYGKSLRMTGKREDGVKYLKASLEVENVILSKDDKASIWLNIALAEQSNDNNEKAVSAAEEVIKYTEKESGRYLQALSIIAGFIPDDAEKKKKLYDIEDKARKNKDFTAANNIAIYLAGRATNSSEKIRLLDRVLMSNEQGYNKARGLVAKAKAIQKQDGGIKLKPEEVFGLTWAYSYFYAQRFMSLFNQCHEVLWKVCESAGNTTQLLRLFRHSSFLWRIRGEENKEAEYLQRLSQKNVEETQSSDKGVILLELRYFTLRVNLVLHK
jgi:calcineurin-like phosphoesterase family protein